MQSQADEIRLASLTVIAVHINIVVDASVKLMRDLAQLSNKDLSLVLLLLSASNHARSSACVPSPTAMEIRRSRSVLRYCMEPACSAPRLANTPVRSGIQFANQQLPRLSAESASSP